MDDVFLAIDPGTHKTGVALFRGESLTDWALLSAPDNTPSYQRIGYIVESIAEYLVIHGQDANLVACEKPVGIQGARPAPELDTLIRSLKSYVTGRAKVGKRKLVQRLWVEYAPATVLASVRLRGVKGMDSKDIIKLGVLVLYSRELPNQPPQDVLDAIAVGHCHLSKTREASILGQAA